MPFSGHQTPNQPARISANVHLLTVMYIPNGGVSLAVYISDHGLAWSGFFVFSSPPSLFSYHNSLMYMMYRHIRVFKRYGEMKSRENPPLFFISLLRSKKVRVLYIMSLTKSARLVGCPVSQNARHSSISSPIMYRIASMSTATIFA